MLRVRGLRVRRLLGSWNLGRRVLRRRILMAEKGKLVLLMKRRRLRKQRMYRIMRSRTILWKPFLRRLSRKPVHRKSARRTKSTPAPAYQLRSERRKIPRLGKLKENKLAPDDGSRDHSPKRVQKLRILPSREARNLGPEKPKKNELEPNDALRDQDPKQVL